MGPPVEISMRFLITCVNILLLWLMGLETPVWLSVMQNITGYQGFQFQNLQSFEVEKVLQNLNVRKSTGWDCIPPMALKLGATELTNLLMSLFNY